MPLQPHHPYGLAEAIRAAHFTVSDHMRCAQASVLTVLGLGPQECPFAVIAEGEHWRLREYAGAGGGPSLLIVAAPIKKPYIWDLCPRASVIGYCLRQGLHVYLLEWLPPSPDKEQAGLEEVAGKAIAASAAIAASGPSGTPPFLAGHSLGGTLAAIYCALAPHTIPGLVLLSAPLSFAPGSSQFRDRLVALLPDVISSNGSVPGSLLSQASVLVDPRTFLWARWCDAALSLADPALLDLHRRVERWALDEAALPGKLVDQIVNWLYREDRLCRGVLQIGGKMVGPSCLTVPTFAAISSADEITTAASVAPFLERMPTPDTCLIEHPSEAGVGLQHLALLVGCKAYAQLWPKIISWIKERS